MGTVSKALTLLDYFSRQQPEIGLSELTRTSGMNKATVYRLLCELQAGGFVEQPGSDRAYRLGPAVLRLANVREATVPMRDVAEAALRRLSDATGETAHISLMQGDRMAIFAFAYSAAHGIAVRMEDVEFLPLHASSTGLAVLAFSSGNLAATALSGPLPAITPHTVTDPERLRTLIAAARAKGHAESLGGIEEDVHSLAVPLFDARGTCVGAAAVATPAARMTRALQDRIVTALHQAAQEIVAHWGGAMPDELRKVRTDAI